MTFDPATFGTVAAVAALGVSIFNTIWLVWNAFAAHRRELRVAKHSVAIVETGGGITVENHGAHAIREVQLLDRKKRQAEQFQPVISSGGTHSFSIKWTSLERDRRPSWIRYEDEVGNVWEKRPNEDPKRVRPIVNRALRAWNVMFGRSDRG